MSSRGIISMFVIAIACAARVRMAYADTTLVSDGQAAACIVVPAGTVKGPVLTAAEDLARYIGEMSGASIPIRSDDEAIEGTRILIGNTKLSPVAPADLADEKIGFDGFILRSVPDGVIIAGRVPQGTAYGVYHFAEEVLGIHWFSPEDDGPTVPQRSTVEIPQLDQTVKPDFAWRNHWWSFQVVSDDHRAQRTPLAKQLKANRDRWWTFNRLFGINGDVFHAFMEIVPAEMFAEHPEYFPYIDYTFVEDKWSPFNRKEIRAGADGVLPSWPRTVGRHAGDASMQRCYSNPDVVKLSAQWTANQLETYPTKQFTTISANDGPWWCACDKCEALGSRSRQYLTFANQVAAANKAEFPDRGYFMLAYMHTLDPVKGMKADPAIVPVVAPLWQCRIHPISSSCPDSAYMRRCYEEWSKIANGRLAYYPYTTPGPFTFPGPMALAEEIRFVHDLGGMGAIRENQFTPKVNWAMLNWMETKLLWDTTLDAAALRRTFIEGYYGVSAADAIERVYIAIEEGASASVTGKRSPYDTGNGLHEWADGYEPLAGTIANCRADIDAAITAAANEPEARRNRIVRDMETLLGKNKSEF